MPLYQVVFHDELISSHHWHSDSLKFSNVKAVRDLRSMLFNTPAMVHLSRDETHKNSARIEQLKHYQQGFLPCMSSCGIKPWSIFAGWISKAKCSKRALVMARFSVRILARSRLSSQEEK